jgi:hypothetical protein
MAQSVERVTVNPPSPLVRVQVAAPKMKKAHSANGEPSFFAFPPFASFYTQLLDVDRPDWSNFLVGT